MSYRSTVKKILDEENPGEDDIQGAFFFQWKGNALTKNNRMRQGRRKDGTKYMYQDPKYDKFMEDLTYDIIRQSRNQGFWDPIEWFEIIFFYTLGKLVDGQNIDQPVFDALEKSRIIVNDRNWMSIYHTQVQRRQDWELDKISFLLWPCNY